MFKSLLLKFPAAYEMVQAVRDRRYLHEHARVGAFAQHGEDRALEDLLVSLDARGPYLDVGCNHPFKLSNTFLLYRHGWRGICVDPLPRFAPMYARWRPEDAFACLAIGQQPGELTLYEFESDVLSTLDATLAQSYMDKGYRLRRRLQVPVSTLDAILERHAVQPPLSLLSIDIEGHELPALRSIDLDRWRPAVVCLEVQTADGGRHQAAIDHLRQKGYTIFRDLGLNVFFVRG